MRNDPQDPEAWYDYAEADLRRSERRLTEGDLQDCIVHQQQCAEKVMKGKLIGMGWALEKTHNLVKLADELRSRGVDVDWFAVTAGLLLAGYIGDRYPGVHDDAADQKSAEAALIETTRLYKELSGRSGN
jgi:HEPN domain-containing protein